MTFRHTLPHLACTLLLAGGAAFAGPYDDFFSAIRNDNASSLNDLLARGFDPNTRDPKGQTGLVLALQEQSPKAVRTLLRNPATDVNALNAVGESPLMMAALKGDLTGAQLLIERGAKVDQPGWAPLHYAASGPEPKLIKLLLDRGASIDAPSPNGTTALMMAAQYGSEDSVVMLLARGADPTLRNQLELGAVDFAKLSGRAPLVKRLEKLAR